MGTISKARQRPDLSALQQLAQRLKVWRTTRRHGQRIPDQYWKAATDLARVHGLHPTSATLKLNYYDLQRRLQARRAPRTRRPTPATFVELPPAPWPPGLGERGTVEVVHTSGARLNLRLPNARPKDLLPLVRLFLRAHL